MLSETHYPVYPPLGIRHTPAGDLLTVDIPDPLQPLLRIPEEYDDDASVMPVQLFLTQQVITQQTSLYYAPEENYEEYYQVPNLVGTDIACILRIPVTGSDISTGVIIDWNSSSVLYDPQGCWNSGHSTRITIQQRGRYYIWANQCNNSLVPAGASKGYINFQSQAYVNGANTNFGQVDQKIYYDGATAPGNIWFEFMFEYPFVLNVGDYVELFEQVGISGAGNTITSAPITAYFGIRKIDKAG